MTVPVGNPKVIQHDENGLPAVGWKLHTYEVGTLNNKTTYSDSDLTVENTNPIILDSLGMASLYYNGRARLIMKNASNITKWEEIDVSVSPDDPAEWIGSQDASFTTGTSFTVLSNQTTIFHINRRVKLTGSGFGTIYGSVTNSSYSAPLTTVTLAVDSGTMDATLNTAFYSTLSADNPSYPTNAIFKSLQVINPTNSIVRSEGLSGYGSFYAISSGTNPSYIFFGNAGGEKARISADNDGTLKFSTDGGVSNKFEMRPSGLFYLNPQDGVNEGGEFILSGAGSNKNISIDNYAGGLRLITTDDITSNIFNISFNSMPTWKGISISDVSTAQTLTNKDVSSHTNIMSAVSVPSLTAGTGAAYTCANLPSSLTSGRVYQILIHTANTGNCTLAPGGGSAINIKLLSGADPAANQLLNKVYDFWYNGTNLIVLNPEEVITGSYTGTLTGCTTSPTGTITYMKIGSIVHCSMPTALLGTSNSTACTITGAPAVIRPSSNTGNFAMQIQDNGTNSWGKGAMDTSGTIFLSLINTGNFTASGSKGLLSIEFTYRL